MALSRYSQASTAPAWLRDNYWVTFRHDVFTLLHLGHARLDRNSLTAAHEEDITGELTRVIEELLDDPNAPEWYSRYGVHEEPRLHSPIRKGKRRQRMDIRIECTDQRPRTHYEPEPMVTDLFTYRSKHERIAPLESITIYHALLPFHAENSALVDDREAARKQEY